MLLLCKTTNDDKLLVSDAVAQRWGSSVWFKRQQHGLLKRSDTWKTHFRPNVFLCRQDVQNISHTAGSKQKHFKGLCVQLPLSVFQALYRLLCLFDERPQHRALVPPLAVLCVQVVLVDVVNHRVWDQVFHAQASPQRPPHLRGAGLVPHPLPHEENVLRVARQRVRLVHGPLGLQDPSTDADEAEAPG